MFWFRGAGGLLTSCDGAFRGVVRTVTLVGVFLFVSVTQPASIAADKAMVSRTIVRMGWFYYTGLD
jgi:hypothetical protein